MNPWDSQHREDGTSTCARGYARNQPIDQCENRDPNRARYFNTPGNESRNWSSIKDIYPLD